MLWWAASLAAVVMFAAVGSAVAVAVCWPIVRSLWEATSDPLGVPPELQRMVAKLAGAAGLETPRIRVTRGRSANAHVRAAKKPPRISVTRRLLERTTESEREGIIGHELGHVRAYRATGRCRRLVDLAVVLAYLTLVVALVALCVFAAVNGFPLVIPLAFLVALAPLGMMASSVRRREFEADRWAARIAGIEAALMGLAVLEREHPDSRFPGLVDALARAVSSHPSLAERREALEALRASEG